MPVDQLAPAEHKSAATLAETALREAIVSGELLPGEDLREVQIAERLGLSRTPVREALMRLGAAGLVEITPNRGARVRVLGAKELTDIYELRAEIEAYAAAKSAGRITSDELDALDASCDRFESLLDAKDYRALVRENFAFHDTVHRASGNDRAPVVIRSLIEMPALYQTYAYYDLERRKLSARQHRAIAEALRERDGKRAAELMREHILQVSPVAVEAQPAGASTRPKN
jgi:DNA-binding GntR family transcriptional regulator